MRATNAKMDFEAFGVRDIELSRLRLRAARVKDVLRFEPLVCSLVETPHETTIYVSAGTWPVEDVRAAPLLAALRGAGYGLFGRAMSSYEQLGADIRARDGFLMIGSATWYTGMQCIIGLQTALQPSEPRPTFVLEPWEDEDIPPAIYATLYSRHPEIVFLDHDVEQALESVRRGLPPQPTPADQSAGT
jgi:hypothetical protein